MAVQEPMTDLPRYPALGFIVSYGRLLAVLVGLVIVAAGIVAAFVFGAHWIWAAGGIAGGALAWVLLTSYTEVVTIISETLLPQ
jgi:hypothetical protein